MFDLAMELGARPDALAVMGEALGQAGISVEGGGVFTVDGRPIAHFLLEDGEGARRALAAAGISVTAVREVLAAASTRKPRASSARSLAPSPRRAPASRSCTPITITG